MSVRIGIELSPVACRIVEIEAGRGRAHDSSGTCVRAFARLPREGVETDRRLSSLQRQPVAVIVWGLEADHRQAVVAHGSFHRMRRAAVSVIRNAGVETRGRVAEIAPVSRPARGVASRSVLVALAPTRELAAVLRWLTDKGLRVESIVTPALALMSLARMRGEPAVAGLIEGYVALEETTTAVALVRDGVLAAACELEWGYQDEQGETRRRGEIASRLADDIDRFLAACGTRSNALSQVCVCGGMPELRSMAVALMELLDVEVETLDSLFSIDVARLPKPIHEFRDHIAELRLAWAVAADWPGLINLLRERERRVTKTVLARAAVVAGVATGIGVAWQIQRSDWWRSTIRTNPRPTPARVANPRAPASAAVTAPVRRPPTATALAPPVAAPVVQPASRPAPSVAPLAVPQATRPAAPVAPVVPVAPVAKPAPVVAQRAPTPVAPVVAPQSPPLRPRFPEPRAAAQQPEPSLPFDAALGTILYAPERKLAIVDGRIVQVGDDVRGARVVEITPTAVLLRDGQGRLRRLALGAASR